MRSTRNEHLTNEPESTNEIPVPTGRRTGFLNANYVYALAFFVTTLCIIVSVLASVLAIWNSDRFAKPKVIEAMP